MSVHCFTSLVHSFTSLGHHFLFSLIDLSVMGRAPCCDKANVKRGPWSPEEDTTLRNYVEKHGTGGNWIALPQKAGLRRCGKSCRLRWLNYLRPNIKHGGFTEEEDNIICTLYKSIGSRWSVIASHLPGRTDNDVKNYWNTKLKKKLLGPNANFKSNSSLISNNHFQLNPSSSLVSIKGENHGIFSNPANGSLNTLSSIELGFQKLYSESIQFPPSGLSETFGFGVNANGQGFRTDNSQFSWSGCGNGEADSFLMDMENLSTYDLLHVCSSQEMGGVAPNSIS